MVLCSDQCDMIRSQARFIKPYPVPGAGPCAKDAGGKKTGQFSAFTARIQRLGKTGWGHTRAMSGDRECHEEEWDRSRWEGVSHTGAGAHRTERVAEDRPNARAIRLRGGERAQGCTTGARACGEGPMGMAEALVAGVEAA